MRYRKKIYSWSLQTSKFSMKDYRSFLYRGNWTTYYINQISKKAVENKKSFFKVAYDFCNEKCEHMPPTLMKFFPCNINSISAIENQTVYLAEPQVQNDPFDCFVNIDYYEFQKNFILKKAKEEKTISDEEYTKLLNSLDTYKYENKFFRMLDEISGSLTLDNRDKGLHSLSSRANDIFKLKAHELLKQKVRSASFANMQKKDIAVCNEMWAHYASNHAGFCVEYDLSNIYNEHSPNDLDYDNRFKKTVISCLLPCDYRTIIKKFPEKTTYKFLMDEKLSIKEQINIEKCLMLAYLRKSTSWSYEHEWRIVLPSELCLQYQNSIPFPYIKSIYLGCRMRDVDKELIINIAKRKGYKIYESKMCEDKYELWFLEVDIKKYFNGDQNRNTQDHGTYRYFYL